MFQGCFKYKNNGLSPNIWPKTELLDMKCWWGINYSMGISTLNLQTVYLASLHLLPKVRHRGNLSSRPKPLFPLRKQCFCFPPFLPPSQRWLEDTELLSRPYTPSSCLFYSGSHSCSHVLPLSIRHHHSDILLFYWLSYSPTSPRIPFVGRYVCLGLKASVYNVRAYSLKYKDSFRVFIKVLLLWSVSTGQHGLLIPQLSAGSCNKLFCWPFWIGEGQLKVQLIVVSSLLLPPLKT